MVIIDYKDNKKNSEFFVVPRNGKALLGIPDTSALKIINVNIDFIEASCMQKENCNRNIGDTKNRLQAGTSCGEGELYKHG